MLQLVVLVVSLKSVSAADATHSSSMAHCVRGCEAKNECRSSLESLSCEAACQAVCKCARMSRMLNKPKHCMSDALEEHQKRLSLFRMSHPRMTKVVLKDDQADPNFASYVPLEDFWPHGHPDEAREDSKPVMLNSPTQLSLLRRDAMPWSPEHRSLGSRSKHHHRRHHSAALLEKKKKATKIDKAATAGKDVETKTKVVANISTSLNATIAVNATSVNATKAGSKATAPGKSATATNVTKSAKVAAPLNSSKSNSIKLVAVAKPVGPAKKK